MGAVSVKGDLSAWVEQTLEAYWRLLGREDMLPAEELPLGEGFEAARRVLAGLRAIPSPGAIELPECRLEWAGLRVEGRVTARLHVCDFKPDDASDELPPPGSEARLRHEAGSIRVLVLQALGGCDTPVALLIARAPNRKDRRMFTRAPASGVALVRLGGRDANMDLFDLSEGGVGLTAPVAVEVGENIGMLLRLEGKESLPIECDGVVTSCRKMTTDAQGRCRLGIRFTTLPEPIREEIRRMVSNPAKREP
ncbi:MAG: PilZ domain-containing protein [Armatimonadetes bacterium]|nr:PilZ domain-containing protein [Armatimonadota bacterium]